MSIRTLVEINHDYAPHSFEERLQFINDLCNYLGSGDPEDLPKGVTWFGKRHHTEECQLTPPRGWDNREIQAIECHKQDTPQQVFFYEQDFYVLSNFSAFRLEWRGKSFDTSEAAYQWEKFSARPREQKCIREARSAHDAFRFAQLHSHQVRPDWDKVKLEIMKEILYAKADQHEYVRRKLLDTGDRELIEDSWRDDFWGWGPNRDGQNHLGRLWMEIRDELQASNG